MQHAGIVISPGVFLWLPVGSRLTARKDEHQHAGFPFERESPGTWMAPMLGAWEGQLASSQRFESAAIRLTGLVSGQRSNTAPGNSLLIATAPVNPFPTRTCDMTNYEDEATVSPGCDKCADLAYAGLLVHDENVDLHERIDQLEGEIRDTRDRHHENLTRVFERAEEAEAALARLLRKLTGYPIDFRDEAQMDAVIDEFTADRESE